jgi:hypothetical protein
MFIFFGILSRIHKATPKSQMGPRLGTPVLDKETYGYFFVAHNFLLLFASLIKNLKFHVTNYDKTPV